MDRPFIEQVRSFNRLVTLRSGALNESYLGRGRPLGKARLLFEIGPHGSDIGALRDRLGLDSGYASRLLKSLAEDRLIAIDSDASDRRRKLVKLTPEGLEEYRAYDAMSDQHAQSLLETLDETRRERLLKAMAEIETLLKAASITIAVEPDDSPDAQACIQSYFRELAARFEKGFDPGVGGYAGKSADEDLRDIFLIARLDGKPVGCGALKRLDASTGEIKRMWVSPDMRGLGLARRLLEALEAEAGKLETRINLARLVIS